MTLGRSAVHIILSFLFVSVFLTAIPPARAELTLTSAYPTLGIVDQNLNVTLSGTGFDAKTRIAMPLDVGNNKAIIGAATTPGYAQGIDINDPSNPLIAFTVPTSSAAVNVTVNGYVAYVAWGFIYSSEFQGMGTSYEEYLTILYEAFFNRDPDTGGWNNWLDELNSGYDREHVLNGFIYAQEFQELCKQYGIKAF